MIYKRMGVIAVWENGRECRVEGWKRVWYGRMEGKVLSKHKIWGNIGGLEKWYYGMIWWNEI